MSGNEQTLSVDDARDDRAVRPAARSLMRGFRGTCPACGQGKLFSRFLHVSPACPNCREALHHHRADDMPAYVVIFIVGHLVVGAYMLVDRLFAVEWWQHLLVWSPATVALSLLLLQPVKGAVVGLQWAWRMHGFDPKAHDHPYGGDV